MVKTIGLGTIGRILGITVIGSIVTFVLISYFSYAVLGLSSLWSAIIGMFSAFLLKLTTPTVDIVFLLKSPPVNLFLSLATNLPFS